MHQGRARGPDSRLQMVSADLRSARVRALAIGSIRVVHAILSGALAAITGGNVAASTVTEAPHSGRTNGSPDSPSPPTRRSTTGCQRSECRPSSQATTNTAIPFG